MTAELEVIGRTFGIEDLNRVRREVAQGLTCEYSQATLWDKRDRKVGEPREERVTLLMRRATVPAMGPPGMIPKTIQSWF